MARSPSARSARRSDHRPARRHDHDAAGDPAVLAAKQALREEVWAAVRGSAALRFPGPENRIPNFVGAEAAAERLRCLAAWERAAAVKANPDSPQLPVRQRALGDGKTLYMAVPWLAEALPFLLLDPDRLTVKPRQAASIKGAGVHAEPVDVDGLEAVDLVVSGCVAVDETLECRHPRARTHRPGIRWSELSDDKIAAIPLLARLRPAPG